MDLMNGESRQLQLLDRCVDPAMSSPAGKRRCSIRPKRACCSTASMCRLMPGSGIAR
jgi:hypothetical protein